MKPEQATHATHKNIHNSPQNAKFTTTRTWTNDFFVRRKHTHLAGDDKYKDKFTNRDRKHAHLTTFAPCKKHMNVQACGAMDGVTGLESWVRWAPLCSPCKLHLSTRKVVGMVVCRNLRWMFIKVLVSAQYRVSDLWIPLTSSAVKIGFKIGNLCRFQHRWIT